MRRQLFGPFFLYFVWSLAFPLSKQLLAYAPPIFLTGIRMTLAGAILCTTLLWKKQCPTFNARHLAALGALTFFSVYMTNILEYWGMSHLSSAKTCFIYSLCPLFSVILSYIHFNERMTLTKWMGLLIGFIGCSSVVFIQSQDEPFYRVLHLISWPELAVAGAAFCSVYGWVLLRMLVREGELPIAYANGVSMLLGGGCALITSLFVDTTFLTSRAVIHAPFWLLLIAITLISNIFCYNFHGYLLKRFTTTTLSFFGLLSPFFTSLHSWLLLGERPSVPLLASTCLILLGMWIVYREEKVQGYVTTS